MKKITIVFFTLVLVVSLVLSLILSEFLYNLSFGTINKVFSLIVSFFVVLSFVTSILLLIKSFSDFVKNKVGSKIRLRLIVLFVSISLISTLILSTIFISIINSLRISIESREGEKISEISRNLLKEIGKYYKETFASLEISLNSKPQKGISIVNVSLDETPKDNVVSNIVEQVKTSFSVKGKSSIIISDNEFLFAFYKSNKIKIAYVKVDEALYKLKKGISKVLQISSNSEFFFYEIFDKYFHVILIILNIPSLFVSILVAYLFSEYIARGISKLSEGMIEVSKGNLEYNISEKGAVDEVKDLIREFNKMTLKLLDAQYRISKIEKMELWKDIARKVAHEIKNPLTPMKLSIQRILLNKDARDFKERVLSSLPIVLEEIDRIDNLITQLSNFAKIPQPNPSKFNFSELVSNVKELFSHQGVDIEYISEGNDLIFADFDQIKQCLINLVKNGIEASIGISNKITIKLSRNPNSVIISVKDYGKGIPDEIKDKILKPYITTKKTGSGLGLSIVETIVVNHRGKLYFESEIGKGSEFFIEIPS